MPVRQARALDGIRVIDLSRHMAAPYGTSVLADHGAEVVKVEGLPTGDPSRSVGTAFVGGESALFLMWNRSKRSVAIDLHRPKGVELVRRLVRTADVFVESYRPGVAERIGLGYEEVAALNDRIVYCSLSAFGRDGPWSPYPGTDPVVQAMSGVMSVTGEPASEPTLVGVPVADFTGAMVLVQGVLLALLARERSGVAQRVDVSMLSSLMYSLSTRLATYWATGDEPARHGGSHSVVAPYQRFRARDGWVVAGAWAADGWPRFCRATDLEHLVDDPRFVTNPRRVENKAELDAILGPVFAARTCDEWERCFNEAGALFGRVHTVGEITGHPGTAGFVDWVDHPRAGRIPQVAPHIRLSATPARISAPPPLLGEHTMAVLTEDMGLSAQEVEELRAEGIVGGPP